MWSNFLFALNAIAPILLYMALGYFLRQVYIKDDAFWKKLNGLVFRAFLSVLLFVNVYDIKSFTDINFPGLGLIVFVLLLLIGVGALASLFIKDRGQKSVTWQVVYRSNYAVVGIPLSESIGGASAVNFASLVSAVSIPIYNVFTVFMLSFYAQDKEHKGKLGSAVKAVLTNPLILGVLTGVVALAIRAVLPTDAEGLPIFSLKRDLAPIYGVLSAIAKASSPLALIVLGARFDFKALRHSIGILSYGTVLRIVIAPIIALFVGVLADVLGIVEVGAAQYATLVAIGGTPVAISSATMVSEIGGDESLATALVASTSLFSMLTLTVIITLLRSFGLA